MMRAGSCGWLLVMAVLFSASSSHATTVDPNASVVHLRKDCTGVSNCFTTTADLTNWLWNGGRSSEPSSSDRVYVHVGPGDFDMFQCDGSSVARGWVSVIGSGRDQTRFVQNQALIHPVNGYCLGGITADSCTGLNFQDLTAYGGYNGVLWVDGGSATWSDVDMVAGGSEALSSGCGLNSLFGTSTLGWYDFSSGGTGSRHFFFGCRALGLGHANGTTNVGFDVASDADIWFYGGDIAAVPEVNASYSRNIGVSTDDGVFRAFGASIRAEAGAATASQFAGLFAAVRPRGTAFHSHGSILRADASASSANNTVFGIGEAQGLVHTPGSAFNLQPSGTGSVVRIGVSGTADIQSPYTWQASSTPPAISSVEGADMFVDTDAGSGGGESHLMVYDADCTGGGGPWRDMVNGSCR